MAMELYGLLIFLYVFSTLFTGVCSLSVFVPYYSNVARKHHGLQLYLREGCSIIALIVVNLLSPITICIVLAASLLTLFCGLPCWGMLNSCGLIDKIKRCRQSSDEPISRSSNIANIQHRAKRPSSITQEVVLTIKQDHSTFPCTDTVSQIEDDGDTCPICLRRIYLPNTNKRDMTETSHGDASDHDSCLTPCNHVMHFKCLRDWLDLHQTCPICRSMQLIKQCKVFRCDTDESVVRGDVNASTTSTHNGSSSNDMTLPTISSGVPHMPTVMPGIHAISKATLKTTPKTTSGTTSEATSNVSSAVCYSELSVSVDLCDPHGISTSVSWAM